MSDITSTMNFVFHEAYDDQIQISVVETAAAGEYMERVGKEVIVHSGGNPAAHPTISSMIKSGESQLLVAGSCTILYRMDSSYTQSMADDFIAWCASNDQSMEDCPGATISYDDTAKEITFTYNMEYSGSSWRHLRQRYIPDSEDAKVTLSADAVYMCVLRFAHIADWVVEFKNIQANTSTTVEKEGTDCYVFFASDVTKGSDTLTKYKGYRLTSGDINVTSSSNTVVIRAYRA